MNLFRYLDLCGGLATLENGTLKLTPPSEFNDPFEMYPSFSLSSREIYTKAKAAGGIPLNLTFEEFCSEFDSQALNRGAQEEHRRGMNESLGAVCFCEEPDSLPMWAYYGQQHTGMVIGYDANQPEFASRYGNLLCKVAYDEQRPKVTHLFSPDDHHYHTKSKDWHGEHEVRILMPFEMPWVQQGQIKGNKAYFIPFPKAAVNTIYFGCRMSPDTRNQALAQLSAWGYSHARMIRFEPDVQTFRLNPIQLTE